MKQILYIALFLVFWLPCSVSTTTKESNEDDNICELAKNETPLKIGDCNFTAVNKAHSKNKTLIKCEGDKNVNLNTQDITKICPGAFDDVTSPRIDLSDNLISELPPEVFSQNGKHLRELNLSHNQLESLSRDHFKTMNRLESLDLSFNNLGPRSDEATGTQLPNDTFNDLLLLGSLNLSRNGLEDIPSLALQMFLSYLDISFNELTVFPFPLVNNSFDLLETIHVTNNNIWNHTFQAWRFEDAEDIIINETTNATQRQFVVLEALINFEFDEGAFYYNESDYDPDKEFRLQKLGINKTESIQLVSGKERPDSTSSTGSIDSTVGLSALVVMTVFAVVCISLVIVFLIRNRDSTEPISDRYLKVPDATLDEIVEHPPPAYSPEELLEKQKEQLARNCRKQKFTHLKPIRSFSCTDLIITGEFYI